LLRPVHAPEGTVQQSHRQEPHRMQSSHIY
jgi:hypothetical protein